MAGKTAVLYARYSSDKQREASIDDQLRVCRDYCKAENIAIVAEYADYALSGKTDHRPEFRRMIANAPESDYVVVYMFDRFSRDRYDSATYKKMLRECGVRVISASEKVEDTPEGGLQEGMLELLSEYRAKDCPNPFRCLAGSESSSRSGAPRSPFRHPPDCIYILDRKTAPCERGRSISGG